MVTKQGDFTHPYKLEKDFQANYEKAINYVKDGLTVKDSCIAVFGITDRTFRNWEKSAIEDLEAGFTAEESNLIKLIIGLSREDLELCRKLSKKAFDIALNDNDTKMIQFLLKTRYGYTDKTTHDVELSSKDDYSFNINIVGMKEAENENHN